MGDIRYVEKVEPEGWLLVRPDDGQPNFSIPYGLMVKITATEGGRDSFQVLEGVNKGRKASVKQKTGGDSFLTTGITHGPAGSIRFSLKKQELYFGSQGPFNAFSGASPAQHFTQVPEGSYPLAIPAFPSAQTRTQYGQWTKYHRMWFRIGTNVSGSRFLHPGEISDGCVTVRQFIFDPATGKDNYNGFEDLPQDAITAPGVLGVPLPAKRAPTISYDKIFEYLILRRLNDQAVGTLLVSK